MVTSMPVTITPQRLAELQSHIGYNMNLLKSAIMESSEWANGARPDIERATIEAEDYYRISYGLGHGNFPAEFWRTEEGETIAKAWMFLKGNDLIELALAAAILIDGPDNATLEQARIDYRQNARRVFMNSLTVGRDPHLKTYHEIGARYPMRVSREEVMKLREDRKRK